VTMRETVWSMLNHYASMGQKLEQAVESTATRLGITVKQARRYAGPSLRKEGE
jgi:hypothetical protein